MGDLRSAISSVIRPLRDRVMLMIGRCVIEAADDSTRAMTLQLKGLDGETLSKVEQLLSYGFTSRPMPPDAEGKAEGVLACVSGDRGHAVMIATEDRRHRPRGEMEPGDSIQYDGKGSRIHLKADNTILISVAGGDSAGVLNIVAGQVQITADSLVVSGDVSDADGSIADIRTAFNSHTHVAPPGGGTTSPPTPEL